MLAVGVTATRAGMTPEQVHSAVELLMALGHPDAGGVCELHHGDCLGGDADFDMIAAGLGIRRVAHPPDNEKLRAFCPSEVILTPEEYKARNRAIVLATGVLIAAPRTAAEGRHGGTWYTVRYGRGRGRAVAVIEPGGLVRIEQVVNAGFGRHLIVAKERINYHIGKASDEAVRQM